MKTVYQNATAVKKRVTLLFVENVQKTFDVKPKHVVKSDQELVKVVKSETLE